MTQSVPTSLNTGQVAAVSVTMTNTGNTTWSTAGGYKLGSQNPENGTTWGLNRVALPGNVIPSQTVTFSFNITAPATAGTYNFQWRIVREGIAWIGPLTPNVAITVNTAAPPPPPPAAAQCADGRDNDGDTKVDMADPGCTGASDNDETDPPELRDYALLPEYGAPTSDVSSDPMWTEDFGRITCKRSRGHVTWSTLWGQRLWTMNQVVTWCWRGIQITSVSRNRYADVAGFPGNPWGFEGWASTGTCNTETCSEKIGYGLKTIATSGKFKGCVLFQIAVCSTHNPYIEMLIGAGGYVSLVKWIA